MPLAVLEMNDQALLIQAEGEPLHAEPGFARLLPQGIETGEAARATAWREPKHSYDQYWCHLNQTPLAARERWARHHADIAFAQLRHLWQSAGSPGSLIILVPGSFSDAQLSLLLGLVEALPSGAAAVIDSALAGCLKISRETLFVDLQLHQAVLTRCRPEGNGISIAGQEVIPDLGMMQIYNSAARHISDLLIRSARHDPLHASGSEQAIYNHLPDWLTRLRWEEKVSDTLLSDQGELPFTLRRKDVTRLFNERLINMRSIVARHPGCHLVLSHASGLLTGISEEFSAAEVAGQSAGIDNVLLHHPLILDQIDGLHDSCLLFVVYAYQIVVYVHHQHS